MSLFTALLNLWLLAWLLHKIYPPLVELFQSSSQRPFWNLGKVVVPACGSQSEKGRQSAMENRYDLTRQGSGVWRALRDGDFEEEDVWEILKYRNSSNNKMVGRSKESSVVSVPRNLPTAARMIPKSSSHNYGSGSSCCSSSMTTHEPKIVQQSAPVNIPDWSKSYGQKSDKASKIVSWKKSDDEDEVGNSDDYDDEVEEEEKEEEEYDSRVPPHEFISRRLARSQISSFSVFEGAGRTLKGRDLSKVRNAVLTKTGFLELL